jgi:nucleoside-diphosphate-sugar epimerase
VERVVYASTDAVNPIGPKEDAVCRPTTLYGHLKLLNETMGIHFFDQFGLDTIGLRFGMNYGPGGRLLASEVERKYASAVVASAIERVAAGEPVTVPFHESTGFHWVYVKDNVRAMSLALGTDRTEGRVFNVCGDQTYTLDDMARVLRSIRPDADLKFGPAPMPSTIRASEAREMNCSAARAELGYPPEYSFERGLSAYVDALAAQ